MTEPSKRIVLVTTGLGVGGAELQVVALAKALKGKGWRVQLVSMLLPIALGEELGAAGLPVISLGFHRRHPNLGGFIGLVRLLRRERPHVLHAHMFHANLLARLARPWMWIPVLICTAHSTYEASSQVEHPREVTWRERAYRLTDWLCDLTTQISQAGLERYVRVKAVPRHKARLIPNGVNTARFKLDQDMRRTMRARLGLDSTFIWLAVGRIEAAKDYPTMLRAFAAVARERVEARLVIVGDGSLSDEMQRLAGNLGLTTRVRFLGIRNDVPEVMKAADGFVMSSAWEGFGLALAEAMACGLPVVATDSGGPREILRDGEYGFLVPPRDSGALAQTMLKVMNLSQDERRQMGEAARRHVVANYSLDRVVDKWEALYRELLERKGIRLD